MESEVIAEGTTPPHLVAQQHKKKKEESLIVRSDGKRPVEEMEIAPDTVENATDHDEYYEVPCCTCLSFK